MKSDFFSSAKKIDPLCKSSYTSFVYFENKKSCSVRLEFNLSDISKSQN